MALETLPEIRDALRALPRASWKWLAEDSGVPPSTIEKIAYGVTENPSFEPVRRLIASIQRMQQEAAQ
jgi:N-glycosylase/DNA lyase